MPQIMVFGDGETYAGLDCCAIWSIPDGWTPEDIEAALDYAGTQGQIETLRVEDEEALAELEAEFALEGGRGVYLAEEIDRYNAMERMRVITVFQDPA